MSHRAWWLVIATLILLGIALAVHDATRSPAYGSSAVSGAPVDASAASAGDARTAADAALARARNQAIAEAVQTLHAYLAVLFKSDRSEADGYWRDGRPEAGEGELRTLADVTGIRADNARPEPLDTQPVPDALQIPVRLRVGGTGPLRHYSGHYRMQRIDGGWRITSASIEPSPTPR
ncbi:hypothetical protein ACF3M1_04785 [Luteimonas sp. WGS1318]|uniref:hypothetical protein n=1 Tax=Luteimonas sp. WGS1318 TaxID=3366815 RepID=UPI00372D8251